MKLLVLLFLLVSINLFGQGITVNSRKYLDRENLNIVEYTTCDTAKTLRMLTDNTLSNIATSRLCKMIDLPKGDTSYISKGVINFVKKTAIDSNLNILLFDINVSANIREPNLEYVMDILDNDNVLHKNIKLNKPITAYVNYFQIFTHDSHKCEHAVITLVINNKEEVKYYYYNCEL